MHERKQQEPTFIRENKGSMTVDRFFLMPGHAWETHDAITASSFSCGKRGAICGVTLRERNQSFKYRWFIRTPNRSSITAATRGAVHRSVAKPNSSGLSSIQRSTCEASRVESFAGLPRPGRVAKADSLKRPRLRHRLIHRQTDRSLTSKSSATSSSGSPSKTNDTAKRRRCSADNAFRGNSMKDIIARLQFY
jgi:hypothetical protein